MIKFKHITAVSIFLCFVAVACKTAKIESNTILTTPASYAGTQDSASTAEINWREFFSDSLLTALVDTALKNNLDVLMTLQKIEIARAQLRLSKGALLPTVSAAVGGGQRKFGLYTMDGAGNITTEITPGQLIPIHLPDYYVGLQTAWELDIWGKLRNHKKAALARYLSTIEGKNIVVTNLITEISTTYYELLALDHELEIIKESIQLQQNALSIVSAQKEAGMANELAVKQFEAQLLNSQILEVGTLLKITQNENKINFLLGRFPQEVKRDKALLSGKMPMQVKAGIPSGLLKNRPDIRQAEFELMASRADVKAAKAAFYPSLSITGTIGFQAFNSAYLFMSPQSIAYSLLGNLTAPLINRSAIKAEFSTAKALQLDALYNYQKSIINGYVEVYNEMVTIRSLDQIYTLRNQQVTALNQSIEVSMELFKTGNANYLEILMTQQNALEARIELINTQKEQSISIMNIYKALGGGWK